MRLFTLAMMALFAIGVLAQDTPEWELVWSDEFTTEVGDEWIFEIGNGCPNLCGWGNQELQAYRRENATIQDEMLVITAKKENFDNRAYTSARMITRGNAYFRYGRIEARIKLPAFQGSWPAFWMLGENITSVGWPECGEIDIMEQVNTAMETHGTLHWNAGNGHHYQGSATGFEVDVTEFNVYAIEWDRNAIKWFVNDQQFYSLDITNGINNTHAFHRPHFLILNMAIGGQWPGSTVDESALPANMYVDYVRVLQIPGYDELDDEETPMDPFTIEAESFTYDNNITVFDFPDNDGQYIRFDGSGSWAAYGPSNITEAGKYLIELRVAAETAGGELRLEANSGNILFDVLDIPATGGSDDWTVISTEIDLETATYHFGLNSSQGSYYVDWIKVTPINGTSTRYLNVESGNMFISPNPTINREFNLDVSDVSPSGGKVKVVGVDGRMLMEYSMSTGAETIKLPENTPAGLYIVFFSAKDVNLSGKILVK